MAGRRTNLGLLALLAVALATGVLAFGMGSAWARWAVVAHGAAGVGILLLAPWKSAIARRGLRRRGAGSWASVVFTALVLIALTAGLAHATGLLTAIGGITAMQVHVAAALGSIPFGVWHVLARRVRPRRTDLSRRSLLRAGTLAAGSVAAYGAVEGIVRLAVLPGGDRRFTGSFEQASGEPDRMPVTQWLLDGVPRIDPDGWRLAILADGREVRSFTLAELDGRREEVEAVLDCTGGWYSRQVWEGLPLDRLMGPIAPSFRSVVARSATGFARRYPLRDAGALWVATRVAGRPLGPGHGFPARIVAPNRRGFWWVKWVTSLELEATPWWWQPPFPL
jgi:DMSO/TMAO reductase YedYZ molybdopterin-dependent catalytic subunit